MIVKIKMIIIILLLVSLFTTQNVLAFQNKTVQLLENPSFERYVEYYADIFNWKIKNYYEQSIYLCNEHKCYGKDFINTSLAYGPYNGKMFLQVEYGRASYQGTTCSISQNIVIPSNTNHLLLTLYYAQSCGNYYSNECDDKIAPDEGNEVGFEIFDTYFVLINKYDTSAYFDYKKYTYDIPVNKLKGNTNFKLIFEAKNIERWVRIRSSLDMVTLSATISINFCTKLLPIYLYICMACLLCDKKN